MIAIWSPFYYPNGQQTDTHRHTQARKQTHRHTHTQTHTDTHRHTRTLTHTLTHTDTQTHRHTDTHTHTHTHRHTHRHAQTHTQKDEHADLPAMKRAKARCQIQGTNFAMYALPSYKTDFSEGTRTARVTSKELRCKSLKPCH